MPRLAGKLRGVSSVDALPGWVSIRGLRCTGRQGVQDFERAREHEYLVDVALRADLRDAAEQDDVSAAMDISAVAALVRGEIASRPRALIERMAADVAQALLAHFAAATEVRVRVEKPHPDGLDADAESVELAATREAR
jgi:dihydroneopterin aldolase